ncbi:phage late control D family protein [Burkholderia gladioli]|uniref:phage late control D family protein n=1 Tax=Burkholderia gladioli TaxID=28095 RepID=UPI0028A77F6F|nr:contractile injection system protein, VgrG/Pvc8 family [Burkholderia gladioli]
MEAIFQIIANGDDVTKVIQDRVMEIRTVDKPGLDADECTITLDDRDGRIRFPPKGATVKVSLGWEGQGLSMLGEYAVDEVGLRGPPASVVFRGKPANMRATSKTQRYGSWSNVRLADIVGDVARRNKWAAACDVDVVVPRVDQFGESDLHFVTRLARQYGATATDRICCVSVAICTASPSCFSSPIPPPLKKERPLRLPVSGLHRSRAARYVGAGTTRSIFLPDFFLCPTFALPLFPPFNVTTVIQPREANVCSTASIRNSPSTPSLNPFSAIVFSADRSARPRIVRRLVDMRRSRVSSPDVAAASKQHDEPANSLTPHATWPKDQLRAPSPAHW